MAVLLGWIAVASTAETRLPLERHQAPWVRTSSGWERAHWLAPKPNFHAAPIHPARISYWMGMAAVLILACGCSKRSVEDDPLPSEVLVASEDRV